MDYSKLLEHLQQSSAYDLYRLHSVLEHMLDDPNRIFRIKKAIHPGDIIEYYDCDAHREVKARVLSFQRSRLLVENLDDQKKFNIPYLAVNTATLDKTEHDRPNTPQRTNIQIGQMLAFNDSEGVQQSGEVIELGTHCATLETAQGIWRVNYAQLFPCNNEDIKESNHR